MKDSINSPGTLSYIQIMIKNSRAYVITILVDLDWYCIIARKKNDKTKKKTLPYFHNKNLLPMSSTNCRLKIENEYCIEKHERNVQIIRLKQKANYLCVLMLLEVKKNLHLITFLLINIQLLYC